MLLEVSVDGVEILIRNHHKFSKVSVTIKTNNNFGYSYKTSESLLRETDIRFQTLMQLIIKRGYDITLKKSNERASNDHIHIPECHNHIITQENRGQFILDFTRNSVSLFSYRSENCYCRVLF